ncbi:MAG: hypothetical protein DMF85_04440 [Acidobacteria bacterium]|nr:MAG: hypothetical protein DMF85_04440 [Acidobacteriota bacterium]
MFGRAAFVLLSVVALAAPVGQTLHVVPLIRDGEVLVSFKLDDALNDDMRAAIHSGLTVKLVYTIDLRRTASVWFDRTIASAVVAATVRYDTLRIARKPPGTRSRATSPGCRSSAASPSNPTRSITFACARTPRRATSRSSGPGWGTTRWGWRSSHSCAKPCAPAPLAHDSSSRRSSSW